MVMNVYINILLDIYIYIYIYIYKGNALPSPLCIKFQEMKAYAKYFHRNNKCMNHESFS